MSHALKEDSPRAFWETWKLSLTYCREARWDSYAQWRHFTRYDASVMLRDLNEVFMAGICLVRRIVAIAPAILLFFFPCFSQLRFSSIGKVSGWPRWKAAPMWLRICIIERKKLLSERRLVRGSEQERSATQAKHVKADKSIALTVHAAESGNCALASLHPR